MCSHTNATLEYCRICHAQDEAELAEWWREQGWTPEATYDGNVRWEKAKHHRVSSFRRVRLPNRWWVDQEVDPNEFIAARGYAPQGYGPARIASVYDHLNYSADVPAWARYTITCSNNCD